MAESLWATLTTEYYYRRTFTTRNQVYTGVATWIEDFYNHRRIHTSLGGTSSIRIRTTPSGPDHSPINKPSTTCAQAYYQEWCTRWKGFLEEKTCRPDGGGEYTHDRLFVLVTGSTSSSRRACCSRIWTSPGTARCPQQPTRLKARTRAYTRYCATTAACACPDA